MWKQWLDNLNSFKGTLGGMLTGTASNSSDQTLSDASADDLQQMICPQTMWDRFIEAINHTIRPALLFGTVFMFVWAALDPSAFSLFALALKNLPDVAWYTIFTIFTAWFTTRGIRDFRKASPPPPAPEPAPTPTPTPDPPAPVSPPPTPAPDDVTALIVNNHPVNDAITAWKESNAAKRTPRKAR